MRSWFFIALNKGNQGSTPYLNVHGRFVLKTTLFKVHLLTIPMFISHTGENIFELLKHLLDVMYPSWKYKIIGYASGGPRNMPGVHQGLGTRILRVAKEGLFRI